jgi:hypothetical protein
MFTYLFRFPRKSQPPDPGGQGGSIDDTTPGANLGANMRVIMDKYGRRL